MSDIVSVLLKTLLRLLRRALRSAPGLVLRILDIAFSPKLKLRQLVLVSTIQLLAHIIRRVQQRGLLTRDGLAAAQSRAETYDEWCRAEQAIESRGTEVDAQPPVSAADRAYFEQLSARGQNYAALRAAGDEYGLMFHLRSELMRRQVGGAGYSRDGSTWLRKHRSARRRIEKYQSEVCNALRYIGSGASPTSSPAAQRLAFINETRHAFGRTALLLSGGGAFGVKHVGVVAALHREQLLPRIVSGTSAGSIVASFVCVKTSEELADYLGEDGSRAVALLEKMMFFGLRRGASHTSMGAISSSEDVSPSRAACNSGAAAGSVGDSLDALQRPAELRGERGTKEPASVGDAVDWDMRRGAKWLSKTHNLLDSTLLAQSLMELCGTCTFLQAFDHSGRVLNITVTRSDGKAPPLLCNYLTTPQLLVYSAALASCAIPGVFEPVELMAMDRSGRIVPYFKTGGWRWTDGGLQADLPKQRLTELFNVNQFIVSQVNPLAPLFVPPTTGIPLIEETLLLLKHQLVGFVSGISQLAKGRLVRPAGVRVADIILQDYEGTVTIHPDWGFGELAAFLSNFDRRRVEVYMLDGLRATWPHLSLIRSLCEVEFTLDEVAKDISLAARAGPHKGLRRPGEEGLGRLPSYATSLDSNGNGGAAGDRAPFPVGNGELSRGGSGFGCGGTLPAVASSASLICLANLVSDVPSDGDTLARSSSFQS